MRVVVIGGNGNFGARICRGLAVRQNLEVLSCSRSAPAALRLDADGPDFPDRLRALRPEIVVHCAGPFQGQDYRVALASIDAGAHYIDLADGRDFVVRFGPTLDARARAGGKIVISGASTLPALSSAVVDRLSTRFRAIQEIQIAIAPAQRAARGVATVRAVFGYAGRRFQWLTDGSWRDAWGWQELARLQFRGMRPRWAAACDVPDLELFPARYPGVRTVQFRAALELGIQHLALWCAAALRRSGVPLPIDFLAQPLNHVASWLDFFGTEDGGMSIVLSGMGVDGAPLRVEWYLIAKKNHGPEVPCIPALLLTAKIAGGNLLSPGATACMGLLDLDDFQPAFARWEIETGVEVRAS